MASSPEELIAIWRAICESPGDFSLRKRYLEALPPTSPCVTIEQLYLEADKLRVWHREPLNKQAEAIIEEHRQSWDHYFYEPNTIDGTLVYHRGWQDGLDITVASYLIYATYIHYHFPIRHLRLRAVEAAFTAYPQKDVFALPTLESIVSLDLSDQPLTAAHITALASSPYLKNLRWLNLYETNLTDECVEILYRSEGYPRLEYVELSRNPCEDPVDAAAGYGIDGADGHIVPESIGLPERGWKLEQKYGRREWIHVVDNYLDSYPPSKYRF